MSERDRLVSKKMIREDYYGFVTISYSVDGEPIVTGACVTTAEKLHQDLEMVLGTNKPMRVRARGSK